MRAVLIIAATAALLVGVIWGVSIVFGVSLSQNVSDMMFIKKHGTIVCKKQSELQNSSGNTCIYLCENGEKTRVDNVQKCLKRIEI